MDFFTDQFSPRITSAVLELLHDADRRSTWQTGFKDNLGLEIFVHDYFLSFDGR